MSALGPLGGMWRYTAVRLAIFLACLGVSYVVGLRGFVLFIVALLVSGLLSYPLARRQRDAMVRSYQDNRRRGGGRSGRS
jgi:Mn2+/Fe2+ NRAMP family transporter